MDKSLLDIVKECEQTVKETEEILNKYGKGGIDEK